MIVLSKVRPFLYSILELTKINGIFGALNEFKRFVCFMKGHEIQRTFSETTLLLHWLQFYIYVGKNHTQTHNCFYFICNI
jgi:hypothetical protein